MKNPISHSQMGLFSSPREQGYREWSTFNAVRDDRAGMYRVHTPEIARGPRYPNAVRIRRHQSALYRPYPLILKGAH